MESEPVIKSEEIPLDPAPTTVSESPKIESPVSEEAKQELWELTKQREKKRIHDEWLIKKKIQFADELIKDPGNVSECSGRVFPDVKEARWRITATTSWLEDEVVLKRLEEIRLKTKNNFEQDLTPERQCERYLEIYKKSDNVKEKILALSQIDKIKGFDKKENEGGNGDTPIRSNVMVYRDSGSDQEWEKKLLLQQNKLISENK